MSPLELFLSLLGIVLAIIFAPPVWHGIKKVMDALERLRWSGAQYRLGILQNRRHIGFDEWVCRFEVDKIGNCAQVYDVRLVNLSNELVSEFFLPIFCDNIPLSVADVAPWAKAGRKTLKVVVDTWDEQRGEGRLKIVFPVALAPGERLQFSYGITLPGLFRPGKDYYNWDIEVPYFDLKCAVHFADV